MVGYFSFWFVSVIVALVAGVIWGRKIEARAEAELATIRATVRDGAKEAEAKL